MSKFNEALQFAHDALTQMRENGKTPRASKKALQKLATTKAPAKTAASTAAPASPKIAAPAVAAQPLVQSAGGSKEERMAPLRARALVCQKCPNLAATRTQVVFGVGNLDAELMFVGEAPGADEDLQGEPFVGRAGQLLTKIIEAMGFSRDTVYIGNVLKCRPDMPEGESGNRKPRPDEMATCLPYLIEQIDIIKPRAMVALGATAIQGLIEADQPMGQLRGRWHEFKGIPLMVTYHPAYLLRNQSNTEKRKVWEDMLLVLEKLGKPISEKQRGYFLSKGQG